MPAKFQPNQPHRFPTTTVTFRICERLAIYGNTDSRGWRTQRAFFDPEQTKRKERKK